MTDGAHPVIQPASLPPDPLGLPEPVRARLTRPAEVFGALSALESAPREFIQRWAGIIALSSEELAAQFVTQAPRAFAWMDEAGVEAWVLKALDAFDHFGISAGLDVLLKLEDWTRLHGGRPSCQFEQVAGLLRHVVRGLGGRNLQILSEPHAYTDTEKIFLPPTLDISDVREENASLYKCLAAFLWAQNRYGTWRYRALEAATKALDHTDGWPLYQRLESLRLLACLERDLPGLRREMERVGYDDDEARVAWARLRVRALELESPEAAAEDSLRLVAVLKGVVLPPPLRFQGEMFPAKVREALYKRVPREKAALQRSLNTMQRDLELQEPDDREDQPAQNTPNRFSVAHGEDETGRVDMHELRFNDQRVPMGPELESLLDSILQDLGDIEDDYLDPRAIRDAYPADRETQDAPGEAPDDAGPTVLRYPEWDYQRQRFREAFCALTEQDVPPGNESFVEDTRSKYAGLSRALRRAFETLLSEAQRQRRQPHGDELDLDAVVDAHVDRLQGREMSDRLYTHLRRSTRSVAVMFMVDMSGSTKGWVNEAERESLILLCEALEMLGDQYAIYGFSGRTNKRCEIYRVKAFDDSYDSTVKRRIAGISPKSYTRMGVAIRHLGKLLSDVPARTKLLITLSDGKPEDYGSYRGRYGVEDTRHALLEVGRSGIHSFCVTIDREAQSYLPHMYGPSNYAVVDAVHKLPARVAEVYRRLTT